MMALWLAGLLAAAAQPSGIRIAGVVVNAVTRQPVAGARVTVAPLEHPSQSIPFVTGQDGRFVFAGMPRGRYELTAQRRGLLPHSYRPGESAEGIVLALPPPSVISGRVVDDAGEPVPQASVELLRSTIAGGRRRLSSFAVRHTDDTGQYRFGSLPEGTYYLAVSGHPWFVKFNETHGAMPPRAMTHTGYAVRYYPNAGDSAAAAPLVLKPGQEADANFALLPVPAASVQVNVEGGGDLTKQFTLTAPGIGGKRLLVQQGSDQGDLYNFWGVPPGNYVLRVQASGLYATDSIDVGASDTEVTVTLLKAPSVSGTVVSEDGGALPARASLLLIDADTDQTESLLIAADGKFSIAAIAPQRCRLSLAGVDGYHLKGWSAGEILDIKECSSVRLKLVAGKAARQSAR